MAKKLFVNIRQPGSTRKGTVGNPFVVGSIELSIPPNTEDGPVHHPIIKESFTRVVPCPDPRMAPQFRGWGKEGLTPFIDLPVTHDTREAPAGVKISVEVNVNGFEYAFSRIIYYYTPSCPLHRSSEEKAALEKERWIRLKKNLGRSWKTIRCTNDGQRRQVDAVYCTIMKELSPGSFVESMFHVEFKGTIGGLNVFKATAVEELGAKTCPDYQPEEKPEEKPEEEPVEDPEEEEIYFDKLSVLNSLRVIKKEIRSIEIALEREGMS